MKYIVDVPKLKLGPSELLLKGESVELEEEKAKRLIQKSYIKPYDEIAEGQENDNKSISDISIAEAKVLIESLEDVDELNALLEEEQQGEKRKGMVKAISERIEALDVDKNPEGEGQEETNGDSSETE